MAVSIASGEATPSATADAASLTIAARMRASIWAASSAGRAAHDGRAATRPGQAAPRAPSGS